EDAVWIGPFGNDPGANLSSSVALPPEAALLKGDPVADTTWPSSGDRGGVARVHRLPTARQAGLAAARLGGGVLPLGALVRPETHVAVYLSFELESAKARDAVLRLGSTGATVVWLNGKRIGEHLGERGLAFDADAFPASLTSGHNRFVV